MTEDTKNQTSEQLGEINQQVKEQLHKLIDKCQEKLSRFAREVNSGITNAIRLFGREAVSAECESRVWEGLLHYTGKDLPIALHRHLYLCLEKLTSGDRISSTDSLWSTPCESAEREAWQHCYYELTNLSAMYSHIRVPVEDLRKSLIWKKK